MSFDRYSPADDDSGKTQGFNDFLGSDNQPADNPEEAQKTSGFNDMLGDDDLNEEQIASGRGGQPTDESSGADTYDSARSGAYSRATGDNNRSGQPKEAEAEATPEQKPDDDPGDEKTKEPEEGDKPKEADKPEEGDNKPADEKAKEPKKDDKPKEAEATGKGAEAKSEDKSPAGGAKKGGGKGLKGVGGAVGKLAGSVGKFAKNNKGEAAIGAGIMGIFTGVAVVILMLAPLKMIDMMTDMFDFHFDRNNSAFDNRRQKTLRQFMREKYNIENDGGTPINNDLTSADPKKKAFYAKIFTRMFDSKFEQELRQKGYHVGTDKTGRQRIFVRGDDGNFDRDNPINDFDLFTEKRKARKAVNELYESSSRDKGWFRRIFEKRRFQKVTGTKWHWLDPVDQPLNRLKKKIATETVEYLLDNKITHRVMAKLIVKIIGGDLDANSFEDIGEKLGKEMAEETAERVGQEAGEKITNEVSEKIGKEVAEKAAKQIASQVANKVISSAAGGPFAIILVLIGSVCLVNDFADDDTFQEVVIQYTQLQYMLTFTKFESVSSQMKFGNQDGNLDNNVMDANLDLLTGDNGEDVGASNNFRRSKGEDIPYDHTTKTANDCTIGKELCVERQPRCAMYSTSLGKGIMAAVQNLNPAATREYLYYCKVILDVKPGDFSPGNVFNAVFEIQSFLEPLTNITAWATDGICEVWGLIEKIIGAVVGFAFDAFKLYIDTCAKISITTPEILPGDPLEFSAPAFPPNLKPTCKDVQTGLDDLSKKVEEVVGWISEHILSAVVQPVITNQVRGPQLANAIGGGASFQANMALLDLGASKLTADQAQSAKRDYYLAQKREHEDASFVEKIASLDDEYSVASQLLNNSPSTPKGLIQTSATRIAQLINPNNAIKNINDGFRQAFGNPTQPAYAAANQDPFGLRTAGEAGSDRLCKTINPADFDPLNVDEDKLDSESGSTVECVYGFTKDQLSKPLGDPLMGLIDIEVACSMVANIRDDDKDKPEECIKAEQAASGQKSTTPGGTRPGTDGYAWPLPDGQSAIGSCYGWRVHPISGATKFHEGSDIKADLGVAIFPIKSGKIVEQGYNGGWGNTVVIDHGDGIFSRYAHMKDGSFKKALNDEVTNAIQIGEVNSTGSSTGDHLHLEIRTGGINGTPHNPLAYLKDALSGVGNAGACPKEDFSP